LVYTSSELHTFVSSGGVAYLFLVRRYIHKPSPQRIIEEQTTTDKTKGTTQMKPQAIKRTKTLAVLTASLLSLSVVGQAAANDIKIGNRSNFSNGKESKPKQEPTPRQESTPKKKQSSPARTNEIDLRSKLASMHLHDGLNLVPSGDGVKLMAQAQNNKIVGWSATDDKGNKLRTTVEKDGAGKVKGIIIYSAGRPQRLAFRPERFIISNSN
jgi:hypothetical protein